MVEPRVPGRGGRRVSAFPLFPLLAAMLLVVLALQGGRMLMALNVVDASTTPRLPADRNVFEDIARVHPKAVGSVVNLKPRRAIVAPFAHNIRVGNPAAAHVLTVFTDPLCTFCRYQVSQVLKGLDTAMVRVVYKYWPTDPQAVESGLIMQLAQQEGKGEALLGMMAAANGPLVDVDMLAMLDRAGLNLSVQRALLAEGSGRLTEQLGRDMAQAKEAGLGPPPAFVLDDYVLDGAMLYPQRAGLYVERLQKGVPLIQGQDYWLNAGE